MNIQATKNILNIDNIYFLISLMTKNIYLFNLLEIVGRKIFILTMYRNIVVIYMMK